MQAFSLTPAPAPRPTAGDASPAGYGGAKHASRNPAFAPLGEGSELNGSLPLPILYRDDHLIAIHKPAGLLVHRSPIARQETRFAVQLLRDQIGRPVWPAHRLDRGTSGLLLFALDPDSLRHLNHQFEAGRVEKTYLAVVRGWPAESGEIDHPLAPVDDPYDPPANPEPQPAVTRYRRLAMAELPNRVDRYPTSRYALLELAPHTGRRHQLRRHLKHISHPIIGDATYGKGRHNRLFAELFGQPRLWLACVEMGFVHPADGRETRLVAPLAAAFLDLLERMGWAEAVPAPWLDQSGVARHAEANA